MQAYAVVHVNYGYAIKQLATLTSEQRERERHGHLRAVQAYTVVVVRNTTDMQSSNQLLLRASSVSNKHALSPKGGASIYRSTRYYGYAIM